MFLCCSVSSQVWRCFRQTCFCVAVFPLKCGVALGGHVSVLQCFLKCGVALDRHVSVLQCFLKCGVALDRHVSVLQCFLSSVALL